MSWNQGGWNPGWWGQDGWLGDGGWSDHNWGGRNAWNCRDGDKFSSDKYANVSTLGLKHPLPLEDRKELVLGLLNRLQEEVSEAAAASAPAGNFRIAVASWGPILIHAVLYYLCRAKPGMPIRTLFNEEKKFVIADAVNMLWLELTTLFPSMDEKLAAIELVFECRFNEPTALLEQAQQAGFDPGEVEVKATNPGQSLGISVGGGVKARPTESASGGAAPAASVVSSSRALQRMSTDEELAHLKKRSEVLQLRKSLAEQEAQLRSPPESPGQSDVRVPQKPEVSQRHESAMRDTLPKGFLQPVSLRGAQGSSASGTSSGVAPPGPLGSGSLRPPSDIHKVGMQALAQGAWSASMALLDGKQPCQSPEQAALENTQRWLDEAASKAKAEHARISALHAMRLEVKELKAALEPEELAEQGR